MRQCSVHSCSCPWFIQSSLRRMFFTSLIWFRSVYKISNSCWFCIHFWIKWELWKTFDAKMIGWTHFRDCTKWKDKVLPSSFALKKAVFSRSSNLKTSIRNIRYPNQISISFDIQHTDRDHLSRRVYQISPTCAKITNAVPTLEADLAYVCASGGFLRL